MLPIQVDYWNLQELKRHHQRDESIEAAKVTESNRHNLEMESQGRTGLEEAHRHNVQQESIGWENAMAATVHAQAAREQAAVARDNAVTNRMHATLAAAEMPSKVHERNANAQWSETRSRTEPSKRAKSFQMYTAGAKNITGGVADLGKAFDSFMRGANSFMNEKRAHDYYLG